MSTMDNWNAPRWADFNASLMSDIDDYFNTEHSELERRHTSGTDSLCATVSEQPQESSAPDDYTEEEGTSNNATLVETNDELVQSVEADEHKADSPKPVEEEKPDKKIVKSTQGRRPRVLTSSVRRQSISRYRRRSDQYVPLAEALKKFQNGTPTRFRSNRNPKSKDNNAAPLQKAKQTRMKLTCPMSPALRSKTRTRTVSTVSQKSETGLKPIAKSSSFPRAFPPTLKKSSINTKPLRKIEKNPPASTSQPKKALLPPKAPATERESDKTLSVPNTSKDTSLLSSSILSKSMRKHNTPSKKMAPTVVSTDEGMKIKEVEVLHFGIPVSNVNKKITRPKPFSFETRTKELQNKKVKLKTQQEEAEKMKKPAFHAKAAPSSNVLKKTTSVLNSKENNINKANPTTRMLTFKERTELALKKKKELMDQIVEKEKKARVFHAKPAPTFKPVFVRGNSTENLRAGEKNKGKTRGISPAARQRGQSQESLVSGNQENEAPSATNQGCPKLKNPLIIEKQILKRTTK